MVTEWLAGMVMGLNRPQVATRPLRLQLPMEVVGVALLLSKMEEGPDPSVVPEGNVIVIGYRRPETARRSKTH